MPGWTARMNVPFWTLGRPCDPHALGSSAPPSRTMVHIAPEAQNERFRISIGQDGIRVPGSQESSDVYAGEIVRHCGRP